MARKRTMNQRIMRLLWGEEDLPELRPEVPEKQATTVSRTEATTSSLRAGCAKKLYQSPHAKIVTAICTIRPTTPAIAIRGSKRAISTSKANLFRWQRAVLRMTYSKYQPTTISARLLRPRFQIKI